MPLCWLPSWQRSPRLQPLFRHQLLRHQLLLRLLAFCRQWQERQDSLQHLCHPLKEG